MTFLYMILAIIIGSSISLIGGMLLFRFKTRRQLAIMLSLPFGAGALLAAAFFDLLPESFELGEPRHMLIYALVGFIVFFLFERLAPWFHHHHEHEVEEDVRNAHQRRMIMFGDLTHNMIDGVAIGAAFLVDIPTGVITTLAVSAHEIPKELGTFAMLLSKGWRGLIVVLANMATAIGTIVMAALVYWSGLDISATIAPLLAATAGFFIYIAASDIIPDIHEQPRRIGTAQAGMLLFGLVGVAAVITRLGV